MLPPLKLVEHGIQNEQSDIRIHVCVIARRLYVFKTKNALKAIGTGLYKARPAYQNVKGASQQTAMGYVIPWNKIEGCTPVQLPEQLLKENPIHANDKLDVKGKNARVIAVKLLEEGRLPIPLNVSIVAENTKEQIEGTDLVADVKLRIQVKCDFKGGNRDLGGTGNLYLQISEANPNKLREAA
jgi:hypothetical protein